MHNKALRAGPAVRAVGGAGIALAPCRDKPGTPEGDIRAGRAFETSRNAKLNLRRQITWP